MLLQICAWHKAHSGGYTSELREARWGGYKAVRGTRHAYVATNLCVVQGVLMLLQICARHKARLCCYKSVRGIRRA